MKGKILRVVIKLILQAALIALTLLLAWAFQSRKMEALGIWHTFVVENETAARDTAQQFNLQDCLDLEKRLCPTNSGKGYMPMLSQPTNRYSAVTSQVDHRTRRGRSPRT
jgi:hypothetical protein